ncbi:ATP-dependent zinc metalloprotease FtsH 3 [Planctomycetes bacterium CA13]|uniref:ATP-dependent zinc metalloprotease FtsH 3 n=1 Tax=Novipirellula herctigrandis TaxID=2527986 RepID=A0A5C5YNM9_9BACT|nr:ATP-dependent zinc metalloprotease FtsH 3 [Planctomycetes bacterium CA13]
MDGLLGLLVGGVVVFLFMTRASSAGIRHQKESNASSTSVSTLLRSHFENIPINQLSVSERQFPYRMRADLQRTIEKLISDEFNVLQFFGVQKDFAFVGISISDCMIESDENSATSVPPEYEELDIGEDQPFRVLKQGMWLMQSKELRLAVLLSSSGMPGEKSGMQVQVATTNSVEGTQVTQLFFNNLQEAISEAVSYRGKILSLEQTKHSYSGQSAGISVHKLRNVERDQVILPELALALLERNVIQFVRQRPQLQQMGMSTKKGLLFYGPPGTGKTHTIHFLAKALEGHTMLLISAEQVALLSEYMALARLLQPSIVVMEDVDLIARERSQMGSACEEALLNRLLNEMDGLKEEADILFILTTNRPQVLEAALASRPGRVDQAIEFPLPDEDGRQKLITMYAPSVTIDDRIMVDLVKRTEGVSAAFIKELMRRIAQFSIERNDGEQISPQDVNGAMDEMLIRGGTLNLSILGASERVAEET